MNPPQPCVILEVGAEGGSITLLGVQTADGWRFRLKSTDHSDTEEEAHSHFQRRDTAYLRS